MFCEKCGAEILNGEKFCLKCGSKIEFVQSIPSTGMPGRLSYNVSARAEAVVEDFKKKADYRFRMLVMALLAVVCLAFLPIYEWDDIPVYHNDLIRTAGGGIEARDADSEEINEEIRETLDELFEKIGVTNHKTVRVMETLVFTLTETMEPEIETFVHKIGKITVAASIPVSGIYIVLFFQIISSVFNLKLFNRIVCLIGALGIVLTVISGSVYMQKYDILFVDCTGIGMWALLAVFVSGFCVTLFKRR